MALNSTPRRRFGVALGVVLTGVTAGLIGFAGVASAHTPQVSAECKGETTVLKVDLTQYVVGKNGKTNHVKISDGTTVLEDKDFQQQYKNTFKVSGEVAHDFTVNIKAWDDPDRKHGWTTDRTLHVEACVVKPPTETKTTETTTTTTTTPEVPPTTVTTSSTSSAPVVATTTSPAPPAAQGGPLAETGASIALPLGIAGVLLAGGVGALFVVRRRSKA